MSGLRSVFVAVFILAFAHSKIAGCLEGPSWKIVGGMEANEGDFPYQVSLRYKKKHFCGGSIIEESWILTAAHCVQRMKPENITVVVGSNTLDAGGDEYPVEKIITHKEYLSDVMTNDIALLKLNKSVEYSYKVKSINLPKEDIKEGTELVLSGWGKTKYPGEVSNKLQMIKLKSIANSQCAKEHDSMPISKNQICTLTQRGEGACHGDSGGPLVHGNKQIGIVSWGKPCAKGKPDVFTRVYSYMSWITENME